MKETKGLQESVNELVTQEQERAKEIYGEINHSDHESYAVILEEYDETLRELALFDTALKAFWMHCKYDHQDLFPDKKHAVLTDMIKRATLAACECIQIAAACKKADVTLGNRADVTWEEQV